MEEPAELAMPNFIAAPPQGNILFDMHTEKLISDPTCTMIGRGVSYKEYMAAYSLMIQDQTLVRDKDKSTLLAHLQQVCQDAIDQPWSAVHKWSNNVFDTTERGEANWDDGDTIQRNRMCLVMGVPQDWTDRSQYPAPNITKES